MSSRRPARRVRPFTPSQESSAVLSDRTVGRESDLEILLARMVSAAQSRNRAHSLLVGPRGAGKTHLLNVAMHRARQHPDVERRLVFVRFDEDAVGISRFDDILAEVMATLAPAASPRRPKLSSAPEQDIAEALGEDRVLVLAMENLDRIFHGLGAGGQQDFRGWVETSGQVMVVATSPSLFKGVRDRASPWWGNFGIHHLDELSLGEGRELLIALARDSGDDELAEFLTTPKAEGRLRAINALAGGSPRVWMILSECLTVETLDELAPAVEALLEGLVPYYQQLLWDLSPVEQRLIREFADGPHHAATVQELATACAIDQRVAASTLKRLADMRWVRADKSPELDRRHSWYRLREPLVRHHFQYRSARDQPLPLIVELLKAWYDLDKRRQLLIQALPGSETERLVAATLDDEARKVAVSYAARSPEKLQEEARSWIFGGSPETRTAEAGVIIDLIITAAMTGPTQARETLDRRRPDPELRNIATRLLDRGGGAEGAESAEDLISKLLRSASEQLGQGRTGAVVSLISICWDGENEPSQAATRLSELAEHVAVDRDDPLSLNIRVEAAHWLGLSGELDAARDQLESLVDECTRILGPGHRETLNIRLRQAWAVASAGDVTSACALSTAILADYVAILGLSHPDTRIARVHHAKHLNMCGCWSEARDELAELADELTDVFDPRHRTVLDIRLERAIVAVNSGEPERGLEEIKDIYADCCEALGPTDRDTLLARLNIAWARGKAGDLVGAIEDFWYLLNNDLVVPQMREAVLQEIRHNLVRMADEPTTNTVPASSSMIAVLQAAMADDAEAFMRLPAELADIVRAARAQQVPASE